MSELVYLKLRDRGTIFHDISQDQSVTGEAVVGFRKTAKVAAAIRNGFLIEWEAPAKEEVKATEQKPKPFNKMAKAELHAELEARGVDFEAEATNAELVALLEQFEAEQDNQ